MSRRRVAAALLVVPVLVGCSAGRDAQTTKTQTVSDAAGTDLAQLQVRNVHLAAPETSRYGNGSDVPLYLTIVNSGEEADSLASVSSDDATSVEVRQSDLGGGAAAPSASPSGGSPTLAGGTSLPLAVPGGGSALRLSADSTHLVLMGLKRELVPGQSVRVTFSFASSGSTTLIVPVQLPTEGSSG